MGAVESLISANRVPLAVTWEHPRQRLLVGNPLRVRGSSGHRVKATYETTMERAQVAAETGVNFMLTNTRVNL